MIVLERAVARIPPLALSPLDVRLEAGTHALLGARTDGAWMVLALLSGSVPLRGGRAQVLGADPGSPQVRRRVAFVPLEVSLPEPFTVEEMLAAAATVRGEKARPAQARLELLGLAPLAPRRCSSLSREEARAVALAEAITSSAEVLLLEEPLAAVDVRALGVVADRLRERARSGACVVVATGSARDARTLADDVLTFDRGALVRRAPATDPLAFAGPRGAAVRVVSSDPKRLAAALATEPPVHDVAIEGEVVVARGEDAVSIAGAVARVAVREAIAVEALQAQLLRSDELRAAIAGDVAGAYRAAYERARQAAPQVVGRPEGLS
ncbi:MAG TPA: ATP-binding cassette domain-containing protein [Polyangiaceae bacterium]